MIHPDDDDEYETKNTPSNDPLDFAWDGDDDQETCSLKPEKIRKVGIYVASSSGTLKTSYYSSINVEGHKGYYHATGYLKGANQVYEATVRCVLKALETAMDNLEGDTDDTPIEFHVVTNMDSIVTGFYKWSKGWKVNGYTNASGNKVNSHKDWKKILKLADSHTIKLLRAYPNCYASKSCKKKAKALLIGK